MGVISPSTYGHDKIVCFSLVISERKIKIWIKKLFSLKALWDFLCPERQGRIIWRTGKLTEGNPTILCCILPEGIC